MQIAGDFTPYSPAFFITFGLLATYSAFLIVLTRFNSFLYFKAKEKRWGKDPNPAALMCHDFSFAFDFMLALTLCQCHFRKISFACSSKISISCRSCSVISLTVFRLIDVRETSICPVSVIARSKVKISSFSIFYHLSKVIRSP